MVITNRLGITDSPTLAREEERISKKAATTLFEKNLLNDMPSGTWTTLQKLQHLCNKINERAALRAAFLRYNRLK